MKAALPIVLLAAAGFISSAGGRIIDPLLAVIAADFSTTVPAVSIVVAAYTLPYAIFQIVIGPLGDRLGKLRVIQGALVLFAVATAACALAGSVGSLALLRVGAGAASAAIIPVAMAYIADATPYAERQVTLSRYLNGIVLSQIIAGPLGGIVGERLGWRGVFVLLAAVGAGIALALARRKGLPDTQGAGGFSLGNFALLAKRPEARRILTFGFLDGALLMGCFPFLAPFMHEHFGLPHAQVGLILAAFGLGAFAYTRNARRLIPLLGERGCALTGGLLMAGGVAAGMLAPHWSLFIPVEIAIGMGFYMLHGVMQARSTELLPQARATAVSAFAFVLFAGQSLGALWIAAVIATGGYQAAFLADAALIVLFTLALRHALRIPPGREAAA